MMQATEDVGLKQYAEDYTQQHGHTDQNQIDKTKERGSPAKLLVTEIEYVDIDKMVRKLTLGQRDISKRNKTILLVGETGIGKTTLIKSLINYFQGSTKEQWVEWSEETEGTGPNCQAQLTIYEVFIETSPISWSIIDIPGYGGPEDTMIKKILLTLLKSYVETPSIDAIGFVVTSTLNRLDDRQLYIFDAAQSLFGKDVKNNIVVFITHAGERIHHNVLTAIEKANVPVAKDKNNQPIHFLYDNMQSDKDDASEDLYQTKWDMGQRSTDCFMTYLDTLETVSLEMTKVALMHHLELERSVNNLKECVQCIECKQNDLDKIISDMQPKEDFVVVPSEVVEQPIQQSTCANCCNVLISLLPPFICCRNNETNIEKGEIIPLPVINTTEEKDRTNKEYNEQEDLKKQVEVDLSKLKERKSELLDEAYDHIIKLVEITLKPNSIFTLVHIDFLIEKMKELETNNTEKVQTLEKLISGVDENTRKALQYLRYNILSDRENACDHLCKAT